MDNPEIRVALDEKDFRALVNGEIVSVEGFGFRGTALDIKMILKDIGWDRMIVAIRDAMEGHAVDAEAKSTTEVQQSEGKPEATATEEDRTS